jgi:hypothetical protein
MDDTAGAGMERRRCGRRFRALGEAIVAHRRGWTTPTEPIPCKSSYVRSKTQTAELEPSWLLTTGSEVRVVPGEPFDRQITTAGFWLTARLEIPPFLGAKAHEVRASRPPRDRARLSESRLSVSKRLTAASRRQTALWLCAAAGEPLARDCPDQSRTCRVGPLQRAAPCSGE